MVTSEKVDKTNVPSEIQITHRRFTNIKHPHMDPGRKILLIREKGLYHLRLINFSGVIGSDLTLTPIALYIALAIAGAVGTNGISPIPLAP